MCRGEGRSARFLYCPRRFGSVLGICRHLIVKEGPKRIAVQRFPYGRYSVPFRRLLPVVYVSRSQLDHVGWDAKWADRTFANDQLCPLGKLYRSRDAARFALALWASIALDAVEIRPSSLDNPSPENTALQGRPPSYPL